MTLSQPSPRETPGCGVPDPGGSPQDRPSSRTVIQESARRLFAERGYAAVSIRDIAAEAGVSPALVIKHAGSKQAMFQAAIDFEPGDFVLDTPVAELGRAIVSAIVAAQRAGLPAPLTRAVVLVLPAPDPDELRRRYDAAYVEPLADKLGGGPQARHRAEMVMAAATGLSVSLRCFLHHSDPAWDDDLVDRYGRALQQLLDG